MSIITDPECLFCKIVAGEVPAECLYEDDEILVFKDINPQAPFHALLIPKTHVATLNDLEEEHTKVAGRLFLTAKSLAQEHTLPGQVIFHVHMHMLAGRKMKPGLG